MDLPALRKSIRKQRRALSQRQQQRAADDVFAQLKYLPGFMAAQHVGVYLANDGELNLRKVVAWLWQTNKRVYLPMLAAKPDSKMQFGPYSPNSRFHPNCFGIPEPVCQNRLKRRAEALDIILVPLVAFDSRGNRMGMGGGYYDRTLAFKQLQKYTRRPKLVGVAHHFQRVDSLPAHPWDIPLDAVVTDQALFVF